MAQKSHPKIDLLNVIIDNLSLDATSHVPKQYLKWVISAKANPGKLTIGEREIPLEFISLEAEIEQKYIDEDVIQEIFPELYVKDLTAEEKLEALEERLVTYNSDCVITGRKRRSKTRANELLNLDLDFIQDVKRILEAEV